MPSVAAFRIECLVSNLLSTFLKCDNSTEHAPGTTSHAGAERRGLPVVALYRAGVLVGLDGCEARLCDPCAHVRPCTGKKTPGGHIRVPASYAHATCLVWGHVRCMYSERAVTVP